MCFLPVQKILKQEHAVGKDVPAGRLRLAKIGSAVGYGA
jgi:hypothetical protein